MNTPDSDLARKIEAILFWKAEPVTFSKLAKLLETTEESVKVAVGQLEKAVESRGLTLVQTEKEITLGTAKDLSSLIESLAKEELSRDLGKAGLETLSIILYQGPIARADIDYIRGVNSQFILRNLLVRGLIERVDNPKDARSFLYKTSLELLSHLGLSKIEDLPEYEQVRRDIEGFKNGQTENPSGQLESKAKIGPQDKEGSLTT
ncbi:MAG: SMC-Scp complex subunit ScpB [Candidatus Paceibacterota bacterium]|jgi:segregation and condensation protein B